MQDLPGANLTKNGYLAKNLLYLLSNHPKIGNMEVQTLSTLQEPETTPPSLWRLAMTYGIYYAAIVIVMSVVAYASGFMLAPALQYVSIGIMIVAVVLIQLHYRKSLGGYISYGQSLGIAVASLFFGSILVAVYTYILYKFIDPALLDQVRLMTEEKLIEQGGMTQEQIDTFLEASSKFQTPGIIAISQILNLVLTGLVIGAISSIFIKKNSPDKIFD